MSQDSCYSYRTAGYIKLRTAARPEAPVSEQDLRLNGPSRSTKQSLDEADAHLASKLLDADCRRRRAVLYSARTAD